MENQTQNLSLRELSPERKCWAYGVEMTQLEEMAYAKYRQNHHIAMNTMWPQERTEHARQWLRQRRLNTIH